MAFFKRLSATGFLARLARDESGNLLAMTAAAVIPMIGVVGGAIDASRLYMVRSRLQAACDSAVLAGRRAMVNGNYSPTGAEGQRAAAMFNFNYKDSDFQTTGPGFSASADNTGRLNGSATKSVPMTMMKMFGFGNQTQTVTCSADFQIPNIDIVFVLDVTGSMGGNIGSTSTRKIDALKVAAKQFYTTLAAQLTANGTNAGQVRYGFVPYDQTVNVKDLFKAAPDTSKGEASLTNLSDTMMVESRVANFDTAANGTYVVDTSRSIETRYQTFYKDNSISLAPYNATTGTATTNLSQSDCSDYGANKDFKIGNGNNATNIDLDPNGSLLYLPEGSSTAQTAVPTTNTYIQIKINLSAGTTDNKNTAPCTRSLTRTPYVKTTSYKFKNWTYKPVSIDVSAFKTGSALRYVYDLDQANYTVSGTASYDPVQLANLSNQTGLSSTTTTWNGCIEERDTTPATNFSPIPADAFDLNSLLAGTSDQTRWRPVIRALTYNRDQKPWVTTTGEFNSPTTSCPSARIRNLNVLTQSAFNTYIDSLQPGGKTYLDLGMIWGLRLIAPQGMFGYRNLTGPNGGQISRHIIFLTDGDPVSDGQIYSGYGVENMSKRITGTTGVSAVSLHALRFQALCDSQRGTVNIWAIAIDTSVNSNLLTCADPGRAYEASNSTQLNDAFNNIARTVADLRLVQ